MDLRRHAPNALSGLRIALVPVLLWLSFRGHPTAFLVTFAFSLSTDLLDGYLARRFRSGTLLGAKLDSWGDFATYAAFPLCAWWAFHDKVTEQLPFVIAALVGFLAPTVIGLAKFRRITSYHTRLAKAVAIVMGVGLILYLGFGVAGFFQAAVLFLMLEAIEEVAITAVLPGWRANVPSFAAALRIARAAKPALLLALALVGLAGRAAAQAALPDLTPDVSDLLVEYDTSVDEGDVAEGCAAATDHRDLVRLSLTTRNDGPGEEELGDPMCPNCLTHPDEVCGNPLFICSPAGGHDHPHYQDFLRYEIVDPNDPNGTVAVGGKRSFCLEDTDCEPGFKGSHTCEDQGLNPHCSDTYPYWLGCQYVDVTDLPDGTYDLRVTVDPLGQIAETDETNNVRITTGILISRAAPTDHTLDGGALLLKGASVLRVKANSLDKLDLSTPDFDPTVAGATLVVTDTGAGEQIAFGLPASGWKRVGKASGPRMFRYKGDGSDLDPCRSVQLSRGGLRARCSLAGDHEHIPLPVKGDVAVQLMLSGGQRLCASFGGVNVRNDSTLVKRRNADPDGCSLD
ncbi:MAG TPA: lysyl oxidase family protein [Myxococcota bacterium]|nr:lysyl oxidase family protein [Myxococcota bacterium]